MRIKFVIGVAAITLAVLGGWYLISEQSSRICVERITAAKNLFTGNAEEFPTPCDVPWWYRPVAPERLKPLTPSSTGIVSFAECVEAGNPIMESYPRKCRTPDGTSFTEFIGNEIEKAQLIRITYPRPNHVITSPVEITGEARGIWFFEASFPIVLVDWDGRIIAEHFATAQSEWMTEEFVPFTAMLSFKNPSFPDVNESHFSKRGALVLRKDNPSGLPEHDDALEIPIRFK